MHPSLASLLVIGCGLFPASAPGAWGQDLQPLEYSRRTLFMINLKVDTVQIRNPNASALRCDSVVLLFPDQTFGHGLVYSTHGEGMPRVYHVFSGRSWSTPDPNTGGYRGVYPYDNLSNPSKSVKIDFPAGVTLDFVWIPYDPCPACKRSAAPAPAPAAASADSLRFRMVLHIGSMSDTLQMVISDRWTVGIAAPPRRDPARAGARQNQARDPLGRWWWKPEACLQPTCYQGNW